MITRRDFLKSSGLALVSLRLFPFALSRSLWAAVGGTGKKSLVVIFQRGAMDGLSLVPPVGDANYYTARPHIAIPQNGDQAAIKLDGYFGMHPACRPLAGHWNNGQLAFIHHVGSPNPTRSHFDAQDFMESGTPGMKNTEDGFLNRAMKQITPWLPESKLRAVALQNSMPRSLRGDFPAISMNSINDFGIQGEFAKQAELDGFEAMYKQAANRVLRGQGDDAFEALKTVKQKLQDKKDSRKQDYPNSPIAKHLREIAELVKADVGLQLAVTEMEGWDTHVNQGAEHGQLADRFGELSSALAAFAQDLGPRFADVCVVTMTEFGRTVKENGDRGTDHGHGSVMLVLGGAVHGKKVYGSWKDLSAAELYEGRDIPVSTDYRVALSELLGKHLKVADSSQIFPAFTIQPTNWLGLV